MAQRSRLESRVSSKAVAGFLSAMLHLGLLVLILVSGGQQDGVDDDDTPVTRVVMLESRPAERRDGLDLPPLELDVPVPTLVDDSDPPDAIAPPPAEVPEIDEVVPAERPFEPPVASVARSAEVLNTVVDTLSTFVMPQVQVAALLERVERLAEKSMENPRDHVTWEQDGRQYTAQLVLERAQNGVDLDRVVAEISAEDRGRQLRTRIRLKRLSYSHFTQLVDRWDPTVQLHDDEIGGRMHVNSRFNVLSDAQAKPALLGKVSTAAGSVNMDAAARRQESDIFPAGIQTGARRIPLSELAHPFEWAPPDAAATVHELARDTHIEFFADGSYRMRDRVSKTTQFRNDPSGQPVYFIAARGVTLYVRGAVAGKVLVYSPQRIVVEGSLTYARDPREATGSADYLGLACDRDIVVAPPYVTGPGDIDIQAALYAKRRFIVTSIDRGRPATLRIFGSLAAGSLSATEPRYATKIEYDRRFEALRPPGFPSTNRFAMEDWDRRWTEVPERAAAGGL